MVRYTLCVTVTALSLSPASAQTMLGAADILDALPPTLSLDEARAVALVPAGRGPNPQGVLFVKGESGWSDPEFVTLRVALTHVRETPDYVLVFRTRRGADRVVNGDGRIEPAVSVYAFRGGTFVPETLEGAWLHRNGSFSGAPDRKSAAELKATLTRLSAPKAAAEAKLPIEVDWASLAGRGDVLLGGFAALGAGLAMLKRRKR